MKQHRIWIVTVSVTAVALLLLAFSIWVWNAGGLNRSNQTNEHTDFVLEQDGNTEDSPLPTPDIEPQHGQVQIWNTDAETNNPIFDAAYQVLNAETGEVIEVIRTNREGEAVSTLLEYGTKVIVAQQYAPLPYVLDDSQVQFEISSEVHTITRTSELLDYVKDYQWNDDGTVTITHLHVPVESVLQNPELPNGCEITSLTAILQTYGYDVSKTEMADDYLKQVPFKWEDGKLYGANPYLAYAGNPRNERGAFFVYGPPIVEAAEKLFAEVGGTHTAVDISGSSREEIMSYLYEGYPVLMWVTLNLEKSRINYSWYFYETEEYFPAPVNLHAVVLHGFNGDELYVMDPLRGHITRDADDFFASYVDLGSHAVVVK